MTTSLDPTDTRFTNTNFADLATDDRVDGSLYTDPDMFEAELEKIFYRTWVWVAHESEIPEAGSYKMATIGRQPVIVNRDRKGNFNVLLNRCRHRGASVCEVPKGKANGFTCPYHSWSYALDGRLRGIPYPDGYDEDLDKKDLPLQSLRVESYAGMIFASFNPDVEPLDEFLGDAKVWIDLFMKQGAGYPIKTQGEHCFRFRGNWKIQLENTTDGYHSWSYALDGRLRGIPYPDGYDEDLDKKDLPLQSLRVESYAGMIFASFNPDIEPLSDFLGDAKVWIDLFMKQGAGYPIKTQGEHCFRFRGNWKIQLENTTDGYHFPIVHRSWMSSVDAETADMLSFMTDDNAVTHALGNGHSVAIMVPEHVDLDHDDGSEKIQARFDHIVEELSKTMPADQVRRIVRSMHGAGFNLNIFPNVAMSMSFFRVLRPIAVDETEIRHIALGMDGGPEIVNRERLRIHEHFQGPFGFGSPDDSEAWDRVQRGSRGAPGMPIMVNRGLNREGLDSNGHRTSHVTDETGMREAYAMWKKMMNDEH